MASPASLWEVKKLSPISDLAESPLHIKPEMHCPEEIERRNPPVAEIPPQPPHTEVSGATFSTIHHFPKEVIDGTWKNHGVIRNMRWQASIKTQPCLTKLHDLGKCQSQTKTNAQFSTDSRASKWATAVESVLSVGSCPSCQPRYRQHTPSVSQGQSIAGALTQAIWKSYTGTSWLYWEHFEGKETASVPKLQPGLVWNSWQPLHGCKNQIDK